MAHSSPPVIRIATRKSPLALAQAEQVRQLLLRAHPGLEAELLPMTTDGDRFAEQRLSALGGKGLFTREIEEALLAGLAQVAVHSLKDMETKLPPGLLLAATPEREDARDVLISRSGAGSLHELPLGCTVGTASLRRAAQVLRARPDVRVVPFRGNVQTRLLKLEAGEAEATLLAAAGLKRLHLLPLPGSPLSPEAMLPAVGQGILGLQCREDDTQTCDLLAPLNHIPTFAAALAERSLLAALDGSCRTPIGGYAELLEDRIRLRAMLLSEDGQDCREIDCEGALHEAELLGHDAGMRLKN